ncbi:MAG: hypothetical protein WD638_02550 [Nitriliruptoraceae bacterium]
MPTHELDAFVCTSAERIELADAAARLRKGAGRCPQPVALLARLGVHLEHERKLLRAALLRDVIQRAAAISDDIGCRGPLVHAASGDAADFYRHLIPELEPSPTDELHLVLLLEDIERTPRADEDR